MPTNSFTTNLLVTGIISQLASYPQPLLRSVLIHPDVVMQPSVRCLFTAIASLRQKLDIIMPTFPHSEEAIHSVRKHLAERVMPQGAKRRGSNVSIMSTAISQLGESRLISTFINKKCKLYKPFQDRDISFQFTTKPTQKKPHKMQ